MIVNVVRLGRTVKNRTRGKMLKLYAVYFADLGELKREREQERL
jgi:hypothetical protein